MIGKTISYCKITEQSCRIGRGVVYIADDCAHKRTVARTFPSPHRLTDPDEPPECLQRYGEVRRERVQATLSRSCRAVAMTKETI